MVPRGTTFSSPVKAVSPGETVVPLTVVPSGVVLEDEGGVTLVALAVVSVVDPPGVVDVIDVVEPPGVVVEPPVVVVEPPGVVVLEDSVVVVDPDGQSVGEWLRVKSACPPSQTTWYATWPPGSGPGPASRKNVCVSPGGTAAVSDSPAKVMSVTVTVRESVAELFRMLARMMTWPFSLHAEPASRAV
jgi:hypothetical protein